MNLWLGSMPLASSHRPFASFPLDLFPSVPVAFLRVWGIGRKGDEPRFALLAKQTHTHDLRKMIVASAVFLL